MNKTPCATRFASHGFICFYKRNPDGTRTQIGSICSQCSDEEVEDYERNLRDAAAAALEAGRGETVTTEKQGHGRAKLRKEVPGEKIKFVLELYRKAANLASTFPLASPERLKWESYAEGLRHALNIFNSYGIPEEIHNLANLIKNSMEFPPETK